MSRVIGTLPVYIVLTLLFLVVSSTCCWRNRMEIKRILCCFRRRRSLSRVRDECDDGEAGPKFDNRGQTRDPGQDSRRSTDGKSECHLTAYSTVTTQRQGHSGAQSVASACSFSPGMRSATLGTTPQQTWHPAEPALSEASELTPRDDSMGPTLGGRLSPLSHDKGSFRRPQWLASDRYSSSVGSFRQLSTNEQLAEIHTFSASMGGQQLRGGAPVEGNGRSPLPGRLEPLANAPVPNKRYHRGAHSASMSCMDQHTSGPGGAHVEAIKANWGRGRHSASMTSMADYAAAAGQERRLGEYSPASAVAGVPNWTRQGSMRFNVETGAPMSPEETKARSPWSSGARRHSAHAQLGSASGLSSAELQTPGSPGGSWRTKNEQKHDKFAHTHKLVDHQTGKPREYSASFMGFKNPKPSIDNLPSWASPI